MRDGLRPITTGLVVGLGGGLLAALIEGLPLLFQGSPWPFLGQRLLALAYLAVLYGALCALVGGLAGAVAWIGLRASRKQASRARLAGICCGLFAAATAAILGWQRFGPGVAGGVVILLLAALLGAGMGWGIYRAARARAVSWPVFRAATVALFALCAAAVLVAGGFRALLRDHPLFNPAATEETATTERPNLVLITAGGIRPDHLGAYGYDRDEAEISPNLDALARRGLRFEQARAQASWTEPSLASLLTSLYPSELGIACQAAISCQPHLDAARTTLAEALQGGGYHTAAALTSPWLTEELGFGQGFRQFETVRAEEPFDLAPMQWRTLGRLLGCPRGAAACGLLTGGHKLLFQPPIMAGWGGDRTNARMARFLDLHGEERFFLWIHYSEALPPYDLEPPFRPLPEGEMASREKRLKGMGYWELGDPFTPRERLLPEDGEGLKALYDGEVHRVDRLVGGVTGLLDAYGLADRTVVVFASDHGQAFGEHGAFTYGHSLDEEVLRVPLIVAGPGIGSPGRAAETPVGLLDLAPTLAELAGVQLPAEAGGRSLVPALRGEAVAEEPLFAESLYRVPYELKAVRRGDEKLVYRVEDGQVALYDLATDPGEQHDLAAERPEVAQALKSLLLDWMARTRRAAETLPRAAPPAEYRDAVW